MSNESILYNNVESKRSWGKQSKIPLIVTPPLKKKKMIGKES